MFTTILFVILFFAIPTFLILLYKANGISLFDLSLITVIFWMYLVFSYIGIIILYFGLDSYRYALGVNDQTIIWHMFMYTSTAYITFMLVYLLGYKLFKKNEEKLFLVHDLTRKNYNKICALLIICLVVFAIYLLQLPHIPIFSALLGASTLEISQYRSQATNGFAGKIYYYRLFFSTGLEIVSFTLFSMILTTKSKTKSLYIMFYISLLFSIFSCIYSGQKAPLIWYLLSLFFVYLLSLNKKINIRTVLKIFIVVFVSIISLYRIFMNTEGVKLSETIISVLSRTFCGQLSAGYYYLEIFPDKVDFLYGKSLPNPGGVFPWDYYNLTVEVMNYKFHTLSQQGIIGTAPTGFWAESYVNFGFLGILIFGIYLAVLTLIIQILFESIRLTSFSIAAYVWFCMEMKNIALTGVSEFLLNIDILFVIGIFIFLKMKINSKGLYLKKENEGIV